MRNPLFSKERMGLKVADRIAVVDVTAACFNGDEKNK